MKEKVNKAKLIKAISEKLKVSPKRARAIMLIVESGIESSGNRIYELNSDGNKILIGQAETDKPLVRHGTSGTGAGSPHVVISPTMTTVVIGEGRRHRSNSRKARVNKVLSSIRIEVVGSNNTLKREEVFEYGLTRRERLSPKAIHGTSGTGAGDKQK
jgi:hypothetical protein